MSRRDSEIPNMCNCCQAGKNVSDLPCGGCQHCQRLHDHWERFEEDIDGVVPHAVRRIECETEKHNDINEHNDICTGEENRSVSELLGAPHVNWLETTTKEQLAQEQKADPNLSILHEWKNSGTIQYKGAGSLEKSSSKEILAVLAASRITSRCSLLSLGKTWRTQPFPAVTSTSFNANRSVASLP